MVLWRRSKNFDLPYEVEHIYPDYELYPQFRRTVEGEGNEEKNFKHGVGG